MKKSIIKLSSSLFIAAIIVSSCNSPAKKVEKAQENLNEAKEEFTQAYKDSVADYELFRTTSEGRIASNEKVITAFKARITSDKRKLKAKDQKMIDEFEQKNIDMRKKMEEYKESTKDHWVEFKTEFNHDMDELGKAIHDLTVKNTK
jgi:phosphoenolpyruvate-protein kinase (PTS system EI component)